MREATQEDIEKLETRAQEFCKRHELEILNGDTAVQTIDFRLSDRYGEDDYGRDERKRLERLWYGVTSRTLGSGAEGIAYGYVGFSAQ
jgi:hypothetical protein